MNTTTNRAWGEARGLDRNTIEQIIQHLPFNCRFRTTSGFSFSTPTPTGTLYVHAPCNQLTCKGCAKQFYHQVHPALCQAIHDHALRFFVSLTLPGRTPPDKQESLLKESLQRLLQYAKRTFPAPLHYAWVIGTGSEGHLHVHMLTNINLCRASRYGSRTAWLKSTWHRLSGAHQVKLIAITPGSEQNVVQYLLKNLFETVAAGRVRGRKYGSSRTIKFRPAKQKPDATWTRHRCTTAYHARSNRIDEHPVMNGEVLVPGTSVPDHPARAEAPLCPSGAAGDTRAPAGAAGGAGVPVPLLAGSVPPAPTSPEEVTR